MNTSFQKLLQLPGSLFLKLADFIGKLTILFAFTLGSGMYWLTIGVFAFGIWTVLLVVTFIWTVADVTASRMRTTLDNSQQYFRSVSRSIK